MNAKNAVAKIAIVTGTTSGIGQCIAERLTKNGFEVYGFGRKAGEEPVKANQSFHQRFLDLTDMPALEEEIKKIRQAGKLSLLVNNAGVAYYGLHEELNPVKISEMVRVNLEVPMILSQLLMRTLKENQGTIINISSVTAEGTNPHGCAYGATKAGLRSFGKSLFEENRKYGVKVITIAPDMTATGLYRNADFGTSDAECARLLPEEVADAVEWALSLRDGMVASEITLRPQRHEIKRKN